VSDDEAAAFGKRLVADFRQRCEDARQQKQEERVPTSHVLKTWRAPFDAVWTGAKPYEYRKDDRNYQIGDTLFLCEWDVQCERCGSTPPGSCDDGCEPRGFLGRAIQARVTFLTRGPDFGIPNGYCVLGIRSVRVYGPRTFPRGKLPELSDFERETDYF
jgi:hypothetical protein